MKKAWFGSVFVALLLGQSALAQKASITKMYPVVGEPGRVLVGNTFIYDLKKVAELGFASDDYSVKAPNGWMFIHLEGQGRFAIRDTANTRWLAHLVSRTHQYISRNSLEVVAEKVFIRDEGLSARHDRRWPREDVDYDFDRVSRIVLRVTERALDPETHKVIVTVKKYDLRF